ncbi:MAG: ribbon-helix-helix protein, CopG family [Clostridia bacterium]|nr:ribbon-helix-helix protein, CopG family [Clostridia bacterium]
MKTKINISLDNEVADKLRLLAKAEHKSMSQWITDKVCEASKKDESKREGFYEGAVFPDFKKHTF